VCIEGDEKHEYHLVTRQVLHTQFGTR